MGTGGSFEGGFKTAPKAIGACTLAAKSSTESPPNV